MAGDFPCLLLLGTIRKLRPCIVFEIICFSCSVFKCLQSKVNNSRRNVHQIWRHYMRFVFLHKLSFFLTESLFLSCVNYRIRIVYLHDQNHTVLGKQLCQRSMYIRLCGLLTDLKVGSTLLEIISIFFNLLSVSFIWYTVLIRFCRLLLLYLLIHPCWK